MPLKTHIDEQPTLNLTPMIDVTFLIIIFFLVGSKIADQEEEMEISVPQVTAAAHALTAAPEKRIVNVDRQGTITLDQQVVTLEQLQQQLASDKSQYEELGVLVRGDGQVSYQPVVTVLSAVRAAGIKNLSIAVEEIREDASRR